MLTELPELLTREVDGQTVIEPAYTYDQLANVENPELYSVFPYRLYGVGKDDIELGRATMKHRRNKQTWCWCQNEIQQAYLGLTEEAKDGLLKRANMRYDGAFFPAYWPANYDWTPDEDHGGNLITSLQLMLMQCEGDKIYLLPAWPKEWDAEFKLHAPYNTTVEGRVSNGKIGSLTVTPNSRKKDVIIINEHHLSVQ